MVFPTGKDVAKIESNQIGMLILVVVQTRERDRVKLDLILLDLTRLD